MKHYSTKVIELGSTAFRQPFAESHCRFLHGYHLVGKFYFRAEELDNNNWVVDFGGLKELKKTLRDTFDHKTVLSKLDPYLKEFHNLHKLGVIDAIVMDEVSIEMFSMYCLEQANIFLKKIDSKAQCYKVEVFEHDKNSGIAEIKD